MSERLVDIPVKREIREKIKKIKGSLSYTKFFEKTLFQSE